jgi:FMN reductase
VSGPVVFVNGSPSLPSRSSSVAQAIAARLESRGLATRSFALRDFDAEDVFLARTSAPKVAAFLEAIKGASAIVLSTPVYKATYTGALKALVDVIPPDALVGTPALGVGTTRLPAHGADLERAFGALFSFFRASAVGTLVVLDEELTLRDGAATLAAAAEGRLATAVEALSLRSMRAHD